MPLAQTSAANELYRVVEMGVKAKSGPDNALPIDKGIGYLDTSFKLCLPVLFRSGSVE